ncbi:cyclic-di-AMP receptor [Paenalkalicoccus suaedae]|uniref:Cyclic-di-AMP receptor n=1 Tax=Paenalkalicoccus suaedae TaxID=2592382 RepID=A0A859FB98_9BACI|nr:cyclic-di-AMP receptor [Paenalkalicoccus suaedae]QKS70633.1 cyclic-di-AMP receptor [Paenalkalicoccus suaedae]
MKLMVCVVQNRYREAMETGLKNTNYRMTELASSGGFLRKGSTTFLIGVKEEDVSSLHETMKAICLEYEQKRGKSSDKSHRYISFLIHAKDSLPFLNKQ